MDPVQVLLVIVQKAVEAVIDKVVLPKVKSLWHEPEFPYHPAFTFQWWRESVWMFGADATLEELLTATISLQQGQELCGRLV